MGWLKSLWADIRAELEEMVLIGLVITVGIVCYVVFGGGLIGASMAFFGPLYIIAWLVS